MAWRWPASIATHLHDKTRDARSAETRSAAGDEQFDLFAAPPAPPQLRSRPIQTALSALDPDALTPRGHWTRSTVSALAG